MSTNELITLQKSFNQLFNQLHNDFKSKLKEIVGDIFDELEIKYNNYKFYPDKYLYYILPLVDRYTTYPFHDSKEKYSKEQIYDFCNKNTINKMVSFSCCDNYYVTDKYIILEIIDYEEGCSYEFYPIQNYFKY